MQYAAQAAVFERPRVSRGKPFWALRYFGPAKVVKERMVGRRAAEFVAFDCTSQEKAAHGHMFYAVQEVPFWAPFDAVFDTFCPGNER